MKLCKDCKHYSERLRSENGGPWVNAGHLCLHPEIVNPVTGDAVDAHNNRAYPELCGYYGNRWEAK